MTNSKTRIPNQIRIPNDEISNLSQRQGSRFDTKGEKFDHVRMRDKLLKYKNIQRLVLKNAQKKQGNEGLYYGRQDTLKGSLRVACGFNGNRLRGNLFIFETCEQLCLFYFGVPHKLISSRFQPEKG